MELKPAAANAERILSGGLLDLAPHACSCAADISAMLASKGLRLQQVLPPTKCAAPCTQEAR